MKKILSAIVSAVLMANIMFPVFANAADNIISVQNGIVEYKVNKENGRYTIHTTEGLPDKASDNDKNLLFLKDIPDTSFTTFRIDGEDYIFGNDYKNGGIISSPKVDGNITTTVWGVGDIEVTQKLQLIVDTSNPNVGNTKISYSVTNKGYSNHEVGSRILLDTQLGSNDASPMLIGANYITNETEYIDEGVPAAWKSADEKFAPGVIAYGLLSGFDNIAPNRMVIAHWQSISGTKWDFTPNELINFTTNKNEYKSADSAVALYYYPDTLKTGNEKTFETFYGIGSLSDTYNDAKFNFQVNTPNKLTVNSSKTGYNEETFNVVVSIDNNGADAQAIQDATITLGLSDELQFASEQPDREYVKNIAIGETYSAVFKVVPTICKNMTVAEVGATINYGENYAEASKFLVLPSVKGTPPKMQMTEIAPKIAYTKGQKKVFVIKGSDFDSLKADYEWTMYIKGKNNSLSYQIMRKDIIIANEALTVSIDKDYNFTADDYDIVLQSKIYGTLSRTVKLSSDPKYDRKQYGTLLVGAFTEDSEGKPIYSVKALENEEDYAGLSDDEKDKVLLTLRGEVFEYEIDGQIQYDCGSGTIINRSILYTAPTDEPNKCLTIKRYKEGGTAWWGLIKDSIVMSGDGFLTIGDYSFHYGDFYVELKDGEEYELAEATDSTSDPDYNWDNPMGDDEKSSVTIVTPANVVAGQILKTVGSLSGTKITIYNAVLGTNTVSLGGSISVALPWMSKAADGGDDGGADGGASGGNSLKDKYDKNDGLDAVKNGQKTDDLISLDMSEMRYGVSDDNSAYLVGLKANGSIQLDDDTIPKLEAGGAHAAFELNSLDYDGMYAKINAGFKVGEAFECDGTVALVFETGGSCIPDSVELVLGGKALRIPLGAGPANVGYLTKIGGGVYNLYNTIKGYYNVIPPLTLKLISGYCDPTLYAFQLDTIALEFGLNGFQLTAEDGKIVGLSLIESAYAKFLVYCTKYDGVMYPCVDIGAGISLNLLGIIKGEGSIWLVADPRIDSVFGHVSLGGKAYVGVFIPDYIPVVGGIELAAVMAELSTYRAYLGIRIIGIPFSVGYYWADKKVKFNDDFDLLANELKIPEEEYENALGVEYVGTDSNSDGLMVFGGNMRETYSSKKSGASLMSLDRVHNIPVTDQDYALFDIQYTDEIPELTITKPDNTKYNLVENDNLLYQTIDASKSKSGITENHIYISVVNPENGTWKIESNKSVDCTAMNVLALPELKNVSAEQKTNDTVKVNWEALNSEDDYTVDIHVSEAQEDAVLCDVNTNPEEYNKEMAAGYDPGLIALRDVPAGDNTAEITIPERLLDGNYQVRVVLKKGEEVFASEMAPQIFTYHNKNVPEKPENIKVELGGDGQYKVTFDASPKAQGYVITVLDDEGKELEGFEGIMTDKTKVYIGNQSSVPTGYDSDGKPTGYTQGGVIPGKSYRVKVYAYNEKDLVTYASKEYISAPIYLPVPDPATISLKLDGISATMADEANENTVGATTNKTSSIISYISNQDVSVSYFINETTDEQIYEVKANVPFEIPVNLEEGGNVIEFIAVNGQNDYTTSKLVATLDTAPPDLMLNAVSILSSGGRYEIVGTTEPNAKVYIGEEMTLVPVIEGSFSHIGMQTATRDEIVVTAIDPAGNETKMTAEVIPTELSNFDSIRIKSDSEPVETLILNQGDTAKIDIYGVAKDSLEFMLESSNVTYDVIYGNDKITVDENGVITALYYGDAVVLCKYNVTENYSFDETVNVKIEQAYEDAKDIRISTTDIISNEAGTLIAKLSIPDAPIGVTYNYTIEQNEYFDLIGNQVILKKKLDSDSASFSVTAQGNHIINDIYENIGNTVSKTFTMRAVKTIASVEEFESLLYFRGAKFENLRLPETAEVMLNTGEVEVYPITWQQGAYNDDVSATYNLKGIIERPENVLNPDDISAKISVTLRSRVTHNVITSPVAVENVSYKYDGETLKVTADDGITEIELTDEILDYETDGLRICIGEAELLLDSNTVEKIKKSSNRKVSVVVDKNGVELDVCGLSKLRGTAKLYVDDGELTEYNALISKDGDTLSNSYLEKGKLTFKLAGSGRYDIEKKTYYFDDTEDCWAKDYISFAAVRNMVNGIGDNKFAPNKNVTRAEFLTMMFNALGINAEGATALKSDFTKDDWFAPYVSFAIENKIANGYEDSTFRPNKEITREEMMVMLSNCIKYLEIELKAGKLDFPDKEDVSDWAEKAISGIVATGLITGNADGTLAPKNNATRSECAVVMMRCIKMITDK